MSFYFQFSSILIQSKHYSPPIKSNTAHFFRISSIRLRLAPKSLTEPFFRAVDLNSTTLSSPFTKNSTSSESTVIRFAYARMYRCSSSTSVMTNCSSDFSTPLIRANASSGLTSNVHGGLMNKIYCNYISILLN